MPEIKLTLKPLETAFQMSCELNTGGGPGSSRSSSGIQIGSAWFQRRINLRPQHRGVHLVTEEVLRLIPEISQFSVGLAHFQSMFDANFIIWCWCYTHILFLFLTLSVLHTSASLALNESWDPDVRYNAHLCSLSDFYFLLIILIHFLEMIWKWCWTESSLRWAYLFVYFFIQ